MSSHGLLAFGEAAGVTLDTAIRAHQFFDLGGGGMKGEFEQFCFVSGVGDADFFARGVVADAAEPV
ncbi:hypothetical protein N8198_03995 [Gammaproteobacteria bacterium]|nr:hypothetical protein [Gammaproteobacteria bacterium]